jgi:hypothetical protein
LGACQNIETDFLDSLQREWAKDGDSIEDKAAIQNPVAFPNVMAKVRPKELAISVEQRTPGNLEPAAFAALRRLLDIIQAAQSAPPEKRISEFHKATGGQMKRPRCSYTELSPDRFKDFWR